MSRADEFGLTWRVSRLPGDLDHVDDTEAEGVLGPDVVRWRELRQSNAALAARLLAGRRAVHAIAAETRSTPWRGFAPSLPGRKPRFADDIGDFSISHSGDLLLVAVVARGRVGVDVEINETAFDDPRIVTRMCSERELATASGFDPDARRRWLALLWTAKEAVQKLGGAGLLQDPRRVDVGERVPHPSAGSVAASIAVATDHHAPRLVLQHPAVAPLLPAERA